MKWSYIIPVILLSCSTCAGAQQPAPEGTDTYYDGFINKGAKFGVRIGDSREVAHKVMVRRDTFYPATDTLGNVKYDHETCDAKWQKFVACETGDTFDYYRKHDFGRDGRIFIFFKEEKVTAIYWDTSFLGTMDL